MHFLNVHFWRGSLPPLKGAHIVIVIVVVVVIVIVIVIVIGIGIGIGIGGVGVGGIGGGIRVRIASVVARGYSTRRARCRSGRWSR